MITDVATQEPYDALLRDGSVATMRPLRPEDEAALRTLVAELSESSLRMRFFSMRGSDPQHYVADLLAAGPDRYAAVALVGGEIVAVASYDREDAGATAEIAFLVADRHQANGLGMLLLEHLVFAGLADGLTTFHAYVLPDNARMISVLREAGFPIATRDELDRIDVTLRLEETRRLVDAIGEREREAEARSLGSLMRPQVVAVIGAGRDPAGLGHRILVNLVAAGFPGRVFAVNPRASAVAGLPAFPSIGEVPDRVDLAVVATPAPTVPDVVRECARTGVGAVVVISAGLGETGRAGARIEAELRSTARAAGMRLVGPNCLGVLNTEARLNATFLAGQPRPGRLAVVSQSGALGAALVDQAGAVDVGISAFVSLGNKSDVSGNDVLLYLGADAGTDVICLYLESFGNPRKFGRIARGIATGKPIVAITAGRSTAGSRAVRSHTAAAASPEAAVATLLDRSGVIRVSDAREMLGIARLLLQQPLPAGRRVAIVGNSGGPGAMAADACEAAGLSVPELSEATRRVLRERLGPAASVTNPVDLTAEGDAERFEAAVGLALADPGVDAVLAIYTPPFGSGTAATSAAVCRAAAGTGGTAGAGGPAKPVLVAVLGLDATLTDATAGDTAVPSYAQPEDAVAALAHAVRYARWRAAPPQPAMRLPGIDAAEAHAVVAARLAADPDGGWLPPSEAVRLLAAYGVRVVESVPVADADAAAGAADRLGYPVVLKADGPGIVHKSDVGGVRLGLRDAGAVRAAFAAMAGAIEQMTGAVMQPMATGDTEMIVGAVAEPVFGPLVMVGLGGVTADLLADRSFGCPPLTEAEITDMIESLRAAPLLHGYRGRPPADVGALTDLVARVGRLAEDRPEVAELDLNPVLVGADGVIAVDVRVRIAPAPRPPAPLQRRLR